MPVETQLRPREHIPDEIRTEGKDDAFEQLEELRKAGNLHGRELSDLAQEIGWSRTHLQNVIRDYYTHADNGDNDKAKPEKHTPDRVEIEVPCDVDRWSYLRGWVAGYARKE